MLNLAGMGYSSAFDVQFVLDQNVQVVNLSKNVLKSLNGCTGGDSIEDLDLSQNQLGSQSVGRIFSFAALKKLDLSRNRLQSFSLERLSGLKVLNLSNNQLGDISAATFSCFSCLESLDLSGNRITAIAVKIPSLAHLNLSNNAIQLNLKQCSFPDKLQKLELSGCGIKTLLNIPPLLTTLIASNNQIASLTEISGHNQLNILDVATNPLSQICHIPNLHVLQAEDTHIKPLEAAIRNKTMREIELTGGATVAAQLFNYSQLQRVKVTKDRWSRSLSRTETTELKLRGLELTGEAATFVQQLINLKILDLSKNNITELRLKGLPSLEALHIRQNPVRSLCSLGELISLRTLTVDIGEELRADMKATLLSVPQLVIMNEINFYQVRLQFPELAVAADQLQKKQKIDARFQLKREGIARKVQSTYLKMCTKTVTIRRTNYQCCQKLKRLVKIVEDGFEIYSKQ